MSNIVVNTEDRFSCVTAQLLFRFRFEPFAEKKILLLDVGSCFNPFSEFDEFHSIGIDICPAVEVGIQPM